MIDDFAHGRCDLPMQRLMCVRHREVLRDRWPHGWGAMSAQLFDQVLGLEATILEARQLTGKDRPHVADVGGLLDLRPACCRLGRDGLLRCYRAAALGEHGTCESCGAASPETIPYPPLAHVRLCLTCVVDRTAVDGAGAVILVAA